MSRDESFLGRWSRLKSTGGEARKQADPAPAQPPAPANEADVAQPDAPAPLPAVESLTPDSDFSPFMRADVDRDLRKDALKRLFEDPRFNVMDGLDVYIDDYSKPDPLPEGWLEKMNQVARLGVFQPRETDAENGARPPEEVGAPAPASALPAAETDGTQAASNDPPQAAVASKNDDSEGS